MNLLFATAIVSRLTRVNVYTLRTRFIWRPKKAQIDFGWLKQK